MRTLLIKIVTETQMKDIGLKKEIFFPLEPNNHPRGILEVNKLTLFDSLITDRCRHTPLFIILTYLACNAYCNCEFLTLKCKSKVKFKAIAIGSQLKYVDGIWKNKINN